MQTQHDVGNLPTQTPSSALEDAIERFGVAPSTLEVLVPLLEAERHRMKSHARGAAYDVATQVLLALTGRGYLFPERSAWDTAVVLKMVAYGANRDRFRNVAGWLGMKSKDVRAAIGRVSPYEDVELWDLGGLARLRDFIRQTGRSVYEAAYRLDYYDLPELERVTAFYLGHEAGWLELAGDVLELVDRFLFMRERRRGSKQHLPRPTAFYGAGREGR